MIKHGALETSVYFFIWSFGVVYSLYNLYIVSYYYNHSENDVDVYDDFAPGWFGRYLDISDGEWKLWTQLLLNLTPWLLLNAVGAEFIKLYIQSPSYVCYWYAVVTVVAITRIISSSATILFLLISSLFYIFSVLRVPWLFWLWGFLVRRYVAPVTVTFISKSDDHVYLIEVACSWLVLRCLAYCVDSLNASQTSLPVFLAYSMYLPTFFIGPLLYFPSFLRQILAPYAEWSTVRLFRIVRSFGRCLFWYMFTIFALHFIYVNAVSLRLYLVESMTAWELAGLGIALGHYFHLKYVVFYGLPSAWAQVENYSTPLPPCCVSRVYLYSFMWRFFDNGLYLFLVRYIYVPVVKLLPRFAGSLLCFAFIYVWHGESQVVLCWVVLNLAALTIEAVAKDICCRPKVKQILGETVSPENLRRLHCLLAAPLHYFSMISNYFFIGNLEVGKIYIRRAINESALNTVYIIFCLYGAGQTALTIEMHERRKIH